MTDKTAVLKAKLEAKIGQPVTITEYPDHSGDIKVAGREIPFGGRINYDASKHSLHGVLRGLVRDADHSPGSLTWELAQNNA